MKRSNFKTIKYIHTIRLSRLLLLVSFLMLISAKGNAQPVANFSADITAVCSGLSVTFTDNTTGITGTTPVYAWDFGATASPSTASGPGTHTVTYTGSGTVTVTLTVTDDAGSDTETKNNYITISALPTIADAGADQSGSDLCGLTSTKLAGNSPATGTGTWSIISGSGGSINAPSNPASPFSGTAGTTYVLRWTISNSPCTASSDDVTITFSQGPTTANAGADQTGATMCGLTSTTLAGNTPSAGTGSWSIVSGTGGSVITPTDPSSTFTGTAGTTYVLRWTISNSPCPASTDDVTVTFGQNPTVANAGADQTGESMCGLTSTTLAGNTPSAGTGSWSIISGSGGSVSSPSSPTSAFSGTAGVTYILRWTISSSPCAAS
ncbi:MAG: C-terminal target protein, partial [Bacteroidetes bacterium]|nr:C-terminal target protein [Bacteroidota bacterium]